MPRRKIHYTPGDWFVVPLREGGYALGLVARSNNRGKVLGYFFGPRRREMPTLDEAKGLIHSDADYVGMFGDLHLIDGKWPILGKVDRWIPEQWPVPDFARKDVVSGKPSRVIYSEQDLREVREIPSESQDIMGLPKDGLSGAGAIETRLTRILSH